MKPGDLIVCNNVAVVGFDISQCLDKEFSFSSGDEDCLFANDIVDSVYCHVGGVCGVL
jgi:hypothetical protein